MSKIAYREKRFGEAARTLIETSNEIIDDYESQGLRLTLRQLYYQHVTRNTITNEEKSYKNLGALISDARLAGLIDWDAIEDRVRRPRKANEYADLKDLTDAALRSYRLPRWKGQDTYAELWVEKDALAGVLEPLARKFHVTLMVNRGYSSQSAMFESAQRFIAACRFQDDGEDSGEKQSDRRSWATSDVAYDNGNEDTGGSPIGLARRPVLFYLGDHDPSGEDMVRDVRDRLAMFGIEVDVQKIALTMAQVKRYNPPPNPAKVTDSRAAGYIAKFGDSSWEVDALPPNVLSQIVTSSFRSIIDEEKMDAIKAKEESDKERLTAAVSKLVKEE
jgi:hypothetical protein